MIKIIKEDVNPRYTNLIKNHYYVRLSKNPEKFLSNMPHRLSNNEDAIVFNSEEEAKVARNRFCTRNKFSTRDFEIITGLDLLKEQNPDEIITEESNSDEEIDIYRGILADNRKEADRYIKSTKTLGSQDFGKGMYWTKSLTVAKNYGNYIYKERIPVSFAKKILDAQDIVLLSKENHKLLNPQLIDQLDIGPNAKYTFYPKLWNDPEMVMEIQERYKDYIKRTNGVFIKDKIDSEE